MKVTHRGRYPDDAAAERYCNPLGIAPHDHIIVGKEGHASFKGVKHLRIWAT